MGYSTDLFGTLELNKQLTIEHKNFLEKLANTRRMKRNMLSDYGVEGEFYVDGGGMSGQDHEDNVVDYNSPPSTQPSLWCNWTPTEDGWGIEWDGGEKFYHYVEWLEYIIENILKEHDYVLNGVIHWEGEESGDIGKIIVKDNVVKAINGVITYPGEDE